MLTVLIDLRFIMLRSNCRKKRFRGVGGVGGRALGNWPCQFQPFKTLGNSMILWILLNLQNKSFMGLKVWLLQVLKSTFFLNLNPLENIIILIRKIKYVNLSQPGDLMFSKHWQTFLIKSMNINKVSNNVWKLYNVTWFICWK